MQDQVGKIRVLFLCTGNSCRSQMAEGWARALHPETIEPWSAGLDPKGLNALAVKAMKEAGVDISDQRSKSIGEVMGAGFDLVVTVCGDAEEKCPVFPGAVKRIHAGFDDPPRLAAGSGSGEEALGIYRRVRDEIKDFVLKLPEMLKGNS